MHHMYIYLIISIPGPGRPRNYPPAGFWIILGFFTQWVPVGTHESIYIQRFINKLIRRPREIISIVREIGSKIMTKIIEITRQYLSPISTLIIFRVIASID